MSRFRILFVDDETNVLQGLQRMLRYMRLEWEMRFVDSGEAALEVMKTQAFDAIVSDMRMPGMDGAVLLAEVSRRYPETVRVVLSGFSDAESVMRTVGLAHQFLAKPCSAQLLVDVIRRAFELKRVLSSGRLRALLSGLANLPTPPDTYYALVEYMGRTDASSNGVAEIIARDVAMTAELLKLTNSSYFSLSSRLTQPLQAVRILGFETIGALVLRIGIFRSFKGLPATGRLVEDINRDSFLVARIARRIAKVEGFDARGQEEAYCAGMLSSIGLLVLLDQRSEDVARVKQSVAAGTSALEAEQQVFGATHFQVGAYLLGLWGFNKLVVEAVAFLGRPSVAPAGELDIAGVVHFARVLAGPSPVYAHPQMGAEIGRLPLDRDYINHLGKQNQLERWSAEAAMEAHQ
ncbi:response regulator [Telmatospirillum sp.]|uniref:response regulator n=1 Tax=Telmatospirillum sp. TaxID=2079197 RepID=UPI00283EEAD0|nr:response regulator [Telmatospirillum sp.]MDR3435238.1 response regulator [Telmatospirillum sp.]